MPQHKPDDPYNCLCAECVYASLRSMGGPWEARPITKKKFMENRREKTDDTPKKSA